MQSGVTTAQGKHNSNAKTLNQIADWCHCGTLIRFKSVLIMLMLCNLGKSLQVLHGKPDFKSSVIVPADPWAVGAVGGPHGFGQGKAWQPGHISCPSKATSTLVPPQGQGQTKARPQCWPAQVSLAQGSSWLGRVGQGYRELETSLSARSLGQGLIAPGGLNWCPGPWTTII